MGSEAPTTPVKDFPKMVEALAAFAKTPDRKEALAKLDTQLDEWRKALGITVVGK